MEVGVGAEMATSLRRGGVEIRAGKMAASTNLRARRELSGTRHPPPTSLHFATLATSRHLTCCHWLLAVYTGAHASVGNEGVGKAGKDYWDTARGRATSKAKQTFVAARVCKFY